MVIDREAAGVAGAVSKEIRQADEEKPRPSYTLPRAGKFISSCALQKSVASLSCCVNHACHRGTSGQVSSLPFPPLGIFPECSRFETVLVEACGHMCRSFPFPPIHFDCGRVLHEKHIISSLLGSVDAAILSS